jgi:outer membrane protein
MRSGRPATVLLMASLGFLAGKGGLAAQGVTDAAPPPPVLSLPAASPPRLLSIEEAQALAREGAALLRARNASLDSALRAVDAASSAYLPSLSASAQGAWLANPPQGITIHQGDFGQLPPAMGSLPLPSSDVVVVKDAEPSWFQAKLAFSQPIVAWGKIRATVGMAGAQADAALAARDAALLDTVREVNRAYYSARLSLESAAILRELGGLAAEVSADMAAALAAGLATRADVLKAEADRAELAARLVEAEEGAASALEGLALLLGLGSGGNLALSSAYRDRLPALDEARILDQAEAASTDRLSAQARLDAAGHKAELERGRGLFLPDLAFFASLDSSGQSPPLSKGGWADTWSWDLSLGLSLSLNLFDGGKSAAALAGARADLEAAEAAARGAADSARLSARRALETARRAAARLSAAEAKAAWTAELLKNARLAFDSGLLQRSELDRAAIQDASLRLELASARYDLEEALADLERASASPLPGGGGR